MLPFAQVKVHVEQADAWQRKSRPQRSADRLQSRVPAVACSIAFWMHCFVNCGSIFLIGFAVDTGVRHGCHFSKYCW